jgi:hypothetical protein
MLKKRLVLGSSAVELDVNRLRPALRVVLKLEAQPHPRAGLWDARLPQGAS